MVRAGIQPLALLLLGACASRPSPPPAAPPVGRPSGETARAGRATPEAARPSLHCRGRHSTATFDLEVISLRASSNQDEGAGDDEGAGEDVVEEFDGDYRLAAGSTLRRGIMTGYRNGDRPFIRGTSEDHGDQPPVELMLATPDMAAISWTRELSEANIFSCVGSLLTAPVGRARLELEPGSASAAAQTAGGVTPPVRLRAP